MVGGALGGERDGRDGRGRGGEKRAATFVGGFGRCLFTLHLKAVVVVWR